MGQKVAILFRTFLNRNFVEYDAPVQDAVAHRTDLIVASSFNVDLAGWFGKTNHKLQN